MGDAGPGSVGKVLSNVLSGATIPAMPDCAMRVLAVGGNPNKDAVDLAKPIEADAGMAAQLLRFVNSSYFGFRQKIDSVPQAVAMLGISKITNFVMWNAVFSVVPDPKSRAFSMTAFRCDALRRGLLARAAARRLEPAAADAAFTAALLQDIAIPVLVARLGETYAGLLTRSENEGADLAELETQTLGWTHADAAAELLTRWGLPESIAGPVRTHCQGEALLGRPGATTATLAVAASSMLPSVRQDSWPDAERFHACWTRLMHTQPWPLEQCLPEVDAAFLDLARAISVKPSGKSLESLFEIAPAPCIA